ncbi:MAG: creatininase family protein [Bacteroidota bacterium]
MKKRGARPYILAETNWKTVRDLSYQLAVLPWGATEAHNYHLPYGTDNFQVEAVAERAAELAWEAGAKVVILPVIPFGVNTGQLDISLCINMNPSTQLAILKDITQVLHLQQLPKLHILNGHGANHFKQMIRELAGIYPDVFISSTDWWKASPMETYFHEPGDHAGEMETSAMLHIRPEWVRPLEEAGTGAAKVFKMKAFQEGWATAQRAWSQVTEDTGTGNPEKATAEKGKIFMEACAEQLASFWIELAHTDNQELYI